MVPRPFWSGRIEDAWKEVSIVWLAGVRRSGKTTLARSLGPERTRYLNCDLPSVTDMLARPETFYAHCDRSVIVLDEIHRLKDPSRVLKIAADEFPHLKILATGSSTLAASRKFRDTLTGRKRLVHLTPVLCDELPAFNDRSILARLLRGGLPEALLSRERSLAFYREWMDSFFARDVQRLFAFRDPDKFNDIFEFVLKQSGGLIETARTSRLLGIGRPTVEAHLRALETTHAITRVRPFHGGGQRELTKMPKVYAFDTGFVCFARGWDPLRKDDLGPLWEHVVLEFLQAHGHAWDIRFWRDTAGREIDFVIARGRDAIDTIECKWDPTQFDGSSLAAFRTSYPHGDNYIIAPHVPHAHVRRVAGAEIHVVDPAGWLARVTAAGSRPLRPHRA